MRVLEVAVQPDIDSLLSYYDNIRIYRDSTYTGTYTLVATTPLVPGQSLYPVIDDAGAASDWYKFTYYKSTVTTAESPQYDLPVYYFTVSALKIRINEGYTGQDDRNFIDAAAAATNAIDLYCNRKFNQLTETRYFQGSPSRGFYIGKGSQILTVDDFVSLNVISVTYPSPTGTVAIDPATGVYKLPEDVTRLNLPYTQLAIIPDANQDFSLGGYWPTGYHAIAITATWGWPTNPITNTPVPAAVKEAAMEIALRLYKGKDNSYARVVGTNDLGSFKVTDDLMNGDTKALLAPYVRRC